MAQSVPSPVPDDLSDLDHPSPPPDYLQDPNLDALEGDTALLLAALDASAPSKATSVPTAEAEGFRLRLIRAYELERDQLPIYKKHYDQWPRALKKRCSWDEVQRRLLDDHGHYLLLAANMEGGGVLFGVDAEGNPLFADGGYEPIMKGLPYLEARAAVYGPPEKPTGYEMFPAPSSYGAGWIIRSLDHDGLIIRALAQEVVMFQEFTKQCFVSTENEIPYQPGAFEGSAKRKTGKRMSWVSQKNWQDAEILEISKAALPSRVPRILRVFFNPADNSTRVEWADMTGDPRCGVRRLLRIRSK
jgi:hypothetical protein